MTRRLLLVLLVMFLIFINGCAQQEGEIQPSVPEEIVEEATAIAEESPPQQDVTVTQPVVQETKVQEIKVEEPKCSREFSPQFRAEHYYTGPLFDAHFHMPDLIDFSKIGGHGEGQYADHGSDPITDHVLGKDVSLDKILCNFDKEKVKGAIGFVVGAEQLLEETLEIAESMKEESSGKINLFLMPVMFSTEGLESIEKSNKGLFKGYGEMTFYDQDYANTPPDSPVVMEIGRASC